MKEPLNLGLGENGWPAPYKELARLMYAVRRSCPRLPLLATSAVNPRHPVPGDHLDLIERLITNGREASEVTAGSNLRSNPLSTQELGFQTARKRIWRLLFLALRRTLTIVFWRLKFRGLMRQIRRESITLVMTTSCPNPELLKTSDDFYYGNLPHLLQKRGISCLRLCMDHSLHWRSESDFVGDVLTRSQIPSVPVQMLIPVWAPLATVWNQILTSLALHRLSRKATDKKIAKLYKYVWLDCLSPATMQRTFFFYIARAAVKTWSPHVFVMLHEGANEKLFWHGVKAANNKCVTVGYQHAAIMPHSLQLLSPNSGSWELSTPDVVLCLGEATRNMIQAGHEPHKTKLISFGAARQTSNNSSFRPPKPERRTVLVVPQVSESKLLFNFAIRVARLLPDHHFILRCHPNMPFAQIRPHLAGVVEEFSNIAISDFKSITEDLARSSVLLYRASSSVFYAVLQGLKPIYLRDSCLPDADPLFELTDWREFVSSPSEMAQTLWRYAGTTEESAAARWRNAAEYAKDYMMPVDESSIDRFLVAAGLQERAGEA
jgi:hypothetical protein